ncbi:MAG: hypothetical protein C0601_01350 [Candidatus Muiribacterium halophilum]|uniref:Outer membrane lipoprotein BamD-like domain-containing protein n=1 Tax=Muiribacterium halophilum TaxID=2053465 RepID=A0A2N5ZLH1_MUIH1|nr:MAG: hypothetical protein C0601_01350 [Candidatus Muirbacterium halophilum]
MRSIKALIFLSLFIIIAFFMIKNRHTFSETGDISSEIVVEKQNISSDVSIDFERYIVEREAPVVKNVIEDDSLEEIVGRSLYVPKEMDEVIELMKKGDIDNAFLLLEEMEKNAGVGTLPWILYFKGHILYMKMNFSKSMDIFDAFLEEYPNHILASNVKEAIAYLEGR